MTEGEPIAGELRCRSMTNGTLIELPPITLAISNAVSAPPGHVHVSIKIQLIPLLVVQVVW